MTDDDKVIPMGARRKAEGRFVTVGGSVDRTRLTLAIYGDHLDPADVTTKLGVQASSTHLKGERRRERYRPNPHSAWFLCIEGDAPRSLQDLIEELLQKLPPPNAAIWNELRSTYGVQLRIGIFMDAWNRGFVVSSEVLAKATHIANTFDFDIYASGDE